MSDYFLKLMAGSSFVAGVFVLIGHAMGWIRFRSKDKANTDKIISEAQINVAEVANKKIDDEVKISKAALEWTVQLAAQLKTANDINDKRQLEIDTLHEVIKRTRDDFEKRMTEMESMLIANQRDLNEERRKNKELLDKLNEYLDAGKLK